MLRVVRPRLASQGHALLRRRGAVDGCCFKHGRRRFSTASAEPSKPAGSPPSDEPGWPLKYKLAGGAILGTVIPWIFSYAVANDPGSRRLVGNVSPGLVQWFRKREKGGHFFDEDPKRVDYLAHVPEWIDQPVNMEVRTGSGETRRLQGLDARTPFSSVAGLVRGEESGGRGREGRGWLTDFEVLDEGDSGDGEGATTLQTSSSAWDTSSSGSSYENSSTTGAVRRDVSACNIRSWWDIAAIEEMARHPAPAAAAAGAAASSGTAARVSGSGSSSSPMGAVAGVPQAQKMSNEEQARAMIDHLDKMVDSLEQDKLTGARSVDDVEEEVRDIRRQQKELRRKYPGRRRFLGLF
ncbi:unnamed protein product [Scytosiphon promiscuus]